MTESDTLARVDHLLMAAREAGKDFDHLAFEAEVIPACDTRTTLSAWLTELEDGLAELSRDLATLPYLEANANRPQTPGEGSPADGRLKEAM